MKFLFTAATLLTTIAALPLHAGDRPINERRPLKPDARLSIDNLSGLVRVEAWDKPELWLTGSLSEDAKELEIKGSDADLKIEVKFPKIVRNPGPSELTLKVPAGVDLDIEAVSADIQARGLTGPIKADSVSGDIQLDVKSRRVSAGTVSGDIRVDAAAEEIRVGSVSGDVTVRGGRGELRGETVSGDLRMEARAVRKLDVETVSGDLVLDLELAPGAEVEAESMSGDVRLLLPALPEGDLDLETFSGEVRSAWSPSPGEGAHEFHREGEPEGHVELNSFSGDITLEKKN